ncbi:MAG: [Fe-Fe] hydrogenase large subunit C-terminal domain-containing protein, partial [Bacillota bacterium]
MSIIGTDESKCRKCHACIRECPVKATKVEDGRMRVVDDICVACGECLEACAVRARYSEDAVPLVESFLAEGSVIAILDPSFPAAFPTVTPGQVVAGLSALGFSEVHDTSFAVKRVLEAYRATLAEVAGEAATGARTTGEGMPLRSPAWRMSSMCPAVVRLVEKHYPDIVGNLVPAASYPVVAARAIRDMPRAAGGGASASGADVRIVYVGPCVARKAELAETGRTSGIDAVLTFDELVAMFESGDIVLRDLVPRSLDGAVAPRERHVVFAGGLSWLMGISKGLSDEDLVIAAGRSRCIEVMDDLARGALTPAFVDASMCRGCLDAPALRRRSSISVRKHVCRVFASGGGVPGGVCSGEAADRDADPGQAGYEASSTAITAAAPGGAHGMGGAGGGQTIDARLLGRTFKPGGVRLPMPSESEIAEILAFSGRLSPQDHLDCGMCGYPTCRAYAIAVYQNMARSDMCVQYLVDRLKDEVEHMTVELVSVKASSFDEIYGSSRQIVAAKDLAERAARSGSTVLLLGESGVGKEVFARAIHAASSRCGAPFVS